MFYRLFILIPIFLISISLAAQQGNVGIRTATPLAKLHVVGDLLAVDTLDLLTPDNPPMEGAGTRLMWYPDKAAFRVGRSTGSYWDKDSIGGYSLAGGIDTRATGLYSTALGNLTTASGVSAIAGGWQTIATDSATTALGANTQASGIASAAMGYFSKATGSVSFAMGNDAQATGNNTMAIGSGTIAAGRNAFTTGRFTQANGFASTVIGMYNDTLITQQTSVTGKTPLFIIGNGNNTGNRSNAMVVRKDASALLNGTRNLISPGDPPASGPGTRLMWYPDKAALRAGHLTESPDSTNWNKDFIGANSVAFGYNVLAFGDNSFAFGAEAEAVGDESVAIGSAALATGEDAFALGQVSLAEGQGAFALGPGAKAEGQNSFATSGARASGLKSIAMINGHATGSWSAAIGNNTAAIGDYAVALGQETSASGNYAVAMGQETTANGPYAVSMGRMTTANGFAGLVIGQFNDTIITVENTINTNTPLFIIGNGDLDSPSNAVVVQKSGRVGIGVNTPVYKLDVNGDINASGQIRCSGTSICSDIRLKQGITNLFRGLEKLSLLRPVQFYWDTLSFPNHHFASVRQLGFVAQEVETVFPELVSTGQDGFKSVDYIELTPVLVDAVQELKQENEMLKSQISDLQDQMNMLIKNYQEIQKAVTSHSQ